MKRTVGTIEEFLIIKETCIFCRQPLVAVLTNSISNFGPNIADINAVLKDDKFQFRIKYDTGLVNVDVSATIDIVTDRFSYYYCNNSSPTEDILVKNAFIHMKPCVKLICEDKKCGMKYCVESDSLRLVGAGDYLRPTGIWSESFIVSGWWIANIYDNLTSNTLIFSHNRPNSDGIYCPRLDFESYPKDKLVNRIKTIVNFS
jgi:hypothetical protein